MASPYIWHSGGRAVGGQWPILLDLKPNELLSSWLLRLALANRCDPLSLTGSLWPGWRIWTLDPDRGISRDRVDKLSRNSGVSIQNIESTFLSHITQCISANHILIKGVWPWVLAHGARGRWHNLGCSICPYCLAERPYLQIPWRLAWHTCCTLHHSILINACPTCHAKIQPHRLESQDKALNICYSCKSPLWKIPNNYFHRRANSEFQSMADSVVESGQGVYTGKVISVARWFKLAKYFIYLIHKASMRENHVLKSSLLDLRVPCHVFNLPITGLPIELQNVEDRFLLLKGAYVLMSTPEKKLSSSLIRHSVPSSMITEKTMKIPSVLSEISDVFARKTQKQNKKRHLSNSTKSVTKRVVMLKWARLLRRAKEK